MKRTRSTHKFNLYDIITFGNNSFFQVENKIPINSYKKKFICNELFVYFITNKQT